MKSANNTNDTKRAYDLSSLIKKDADSSSKDRTVSTEAGSVDPNQSKKQELFVDQAIEQKRRSNGNTNKR